MTRPPRLERGWVRQSGDGAIDCTARSDSWLPIHHRLCEPMSLQVSDEDGGADLAHRCVQFRVIADHECEGKPRDKRRGKDSDSEKSGDHLRLSVLVEYVLNIGANPNITIP
jgi:hypothetical protein